MHLPLDSQPTSNLCNSSYIARNATKYLQKVQEFYWFIILHHFLIDKFALCVGNKYFIVKSLKIDATAIATVQNSIIISASAGFLCLLTVITSLSNGP